MLSPFNKILLAVFLFGIFSCNENPEKQITEKKTEKYKLKIPKGFTDMVFPEGNELTQERIELGEKLFFDVLL